ncbi:MAG: MIP/aquaporin family protein [Crocinitomicaceae bacterium]
MKLSQPYFGELLGTFILVFIGCSTVALSVLSIAFPTLLQVALVWGFGVTLAIYISRKFCPAHLNPAVSLALFFDKKINFKTLIGFIIVQLIGAMIAGLGVYLIFNNIIIDFETVHQITRGSANSRVSAKMFGEFFPNPGSPITEVSHLVAMFAEGAGTFLLMLVIFIEGNSRRKTGPIAPLIIGATVTVIILLFAPYTQGGFNPARDFGPRLIAYFSGWNDAAFPATKYGFFTVYILAPFLGSSLAYLGHRILKRKS